MIAFTFRTSTSRHATARAVQDLISVVPWQIEGRASAGNTYIGRRTFGGQTAPRMCVSLATPLLLLQATYPCDTDYRVVRHGGVDRGSDQECEYLRFLRWFIRREVGLGVTGYKKVVVGGVAQSRAKSRSLEQGRRIRLASLLACGSLSEAENFIYSPALFLQFQQGNVS
jgi:hypothetical protein